MRSPTLGLLLAVLLGIVGLDATTLLAEVATGSRYGTIFELYYVDGDMIFSAECDAGTNILNRSTCSQRIRKAKANLFFEKVSTLYGPRLNRSQIAVREAWVNLEQVNARLFILLSTSPNLPTSPVTIEQVNAKRDELADVDVDLTAVADQIARLRQRILNGDNDPDLGAQLQIYQARTTELVRLQAHLQGELQVLTRTYIQDRVDQTNDEFHYLSEMRSEYERQWQLAQGHVANELTSIVRGQQTLNKVKEQGFTWLDSSQVHLYGITEVINAFDYAEIESRTYRTVSSEHRNRLVVTIPADGMIETVACRFPVYQADHCDVSIGQITGPGPVRDGAILPFNAVSRELTFDTVNHVYHHSYMQQAGMLTRNIRGDVEIFLACDMLTINNTDTTSRCAVRLAP